MAAISKGETIILPSGKPATVTLVYRDGTHVATARLDSVFGWQDVYETSTVRPATEAEIATYMASAKAFQAYGATDAPVHAQSWNLWQADRLGIAL